jgi:hypothetical protein
MDEMIKIQTNKETLLIKIQINALHQIHFKTL